MDTQDTFGQYIARRRKHMGLTQEELAEKVGVSKSAIAKWENNGGLPDRDNLKRLSDVINISVDELHRVINYSESFDDDIGVNITGDVIALLESYGYEVRRKGG